MTNPELRPHAPPLPASVSEFIKNRRMPFKRTLNDQVEDIHLKLYDDDKYVGYWEAVYDAQAVEGSLAADNLMAASMVRERAKKDGNNYVGSQKLAVIAMSLGVVMRRYHASRKERRNMINNEIVPPSAPTGDDGANGD